MKFCTNCGTQMPAEQKFCTKCGSPQKVVEAAPAPVEPTPIPEPAPEPTPEPAPIKKSPEYPNTVQMVLGLGKAGIVHDVFELPEVVNPTVRDAWDRDQLVALIINESGSEHRLVIAASDVPENSYGFLIGGAESARYGNWIVYVTLIEGDSNSSAVLIEKVFETLG
jgi:hypothetical protein